MVFRAACRVAGNASDAEDVLQTVFLRLARREADAEALANPESYLRRAAVNCALDLVRSRQRAAEVALDHAPPPTDGPERSFRSREIRDWLRAAVARLSPTVAEVFVLRFFEGKDNREIARTIGTSEGTVAVTLHRARARIRREYIEYTGGGR